MSLRLIDIINTLSVKVVSEVSQPVEKSKDEYYYRLGKRLNDPSTSAKILMDYFKDFLQ